MPRALVGEVHAVRPQRCAVGPHQGVQVIDGNSMSGHNFGSGTVIGVYYNTLRGIREGGVNEERLSRIGMKDHSKGVFDIG